MNWSIVPANSGRPIDTSGFRFKYLRAVLKFHAIICGVQSTIRPFSESQLGALDEPDLKSRKTLGSRAMSMLSGLVMAMYVLINADLMIYLTNDIYKNSHLLASLLKPLDRNDSRTAVIGRDEKGIDLTQKMRLLHAQVYLVVMTSTLFCYPYNFVYYRFFSAYNCYTVQEVINNHSEQQRTDSIVSSFLREFRQSSKVFKQEYSISSVWDLTLFRRSLEGRHLPLAVEDLRSAHFVTPPASAPPDDPIDLRRILRPTNKSKDWVEMRVKRQFCCYQIALIYTSLLFFFASFCSHLGPYELLDSSSAFNRDMEFYLTLLIAGFSSMFYQLNSMIRGLDQAKFTEAIGKIFYSCIKNNWRAYAAHRTSPPRSIRNHLNANLFYAVSQYKIFFAHLNAGILQSFELFMPLMILMILSPLVIGLHVPYLAENEITRLWTIGFGCVSIACDVSIMPVAYFHSKCLRLYRSLYSVLAHAVEIQELSRYESGGEVFDRHLVEMVRREMANPLQAAQRFETSVLGVSCTYSFLCKVHFWFGAINLSIAVGRGASDNQVFQVLFS